MKWIRLAAAMAAFIVLAQASPDDTAGKTDPKSITNLQNANQAPAAQAQEQQNVVPNEVQQNAQKQYEKIKQGAPNPPQNTPQPAAPAPAPAAPVENQPQTQTQPQNQNQNQNQQPADDDPEAEPSAPPPAQLSLAERIKLAREAEKDFFGKILWMFRPRAGVATSCSLRRRPNQPPPPNGHWIVLPESMGTGYCGRVVTVQRPVALAVRGGTLNLRRTSGVVWDLCNDCPSDTIVATRDVWEDLGYRLGVGRMPVIWAIKPIK